MSTCILAYRKDGTTFWNHICLQVATFCTCLEASASRLLSRVSSLLSLFASVTVYVGCALPAPPSFPPKCVKSVTRWFALLCVMQPVWDTSGALRFYVCTQYTGTSGVGNLVRDIGASFPSGLQTHATIAPILPSKNLF